MRESLRQRHYEEFSLALEDAVKRIIGEVAEDIRKKTDLVASKPDSLRPDRYSLHAIESVIRRTFYSHFQHPKQPKTVFVVPAAAAHPSSKDAAFTGKAALFLKEWINEGLTEDRIIRIACGMFLEKLVVQDATLTHVDELAARAGISAQRAWGQLAACMDPRLRPQLSKEWFPPKWQHWQSNHLPQNWHIHLSHKKKKFTFRQNSDARHLAQEFLLSIRKAHNESYLEIITLLFDRHLRDGTALTLMELATVLEEPISIAQPLMENLQREIHTDKDRRFDIGGDATGGWYVERERKASILCSVTKIDDQSFDKAFQSETV